MQQEITAFPPLPPTSRRVRFGLESSTEVSTCPTEIHAKTLTFQKSIQIPGQQIPGQQIPSKQSLNVNLRKEEIPVDCPTYTRISRFFLCFRRFINRISSWQSLFSRLDCMLLSDRWSVLFCCPILLMLCNYFCLVMSVTHGAFSPTCGR